MTTLLYFLKIVIYFILFLKIISREQWLNNIIDFLFLKTDFFFKSLSQTYSDILF